MSDAARSTSDHPIVVGFYKTLDQIRSQTIPSLKSRTEAIRACVSQTRVVREKLDRAAETLANEDDDDDVRETTGPQLKIVTQG